MSLLYGVSAIHQATAANRPHQFGHNTARTAANDTLFEVFNGPTNASRRFAIDLNGRPYLATAALAVGDLLYGVAGGVTNLRRLDSLAIGAAGTVLRSTGTAPAWTTATFPATAVAGDLLHASATNVWSSLADVATGSVLVSGGVGVAPAWSASPTLTALTATTLTGTLATVSQPNVTTMAGLVTVGALASGSIASGFGSINIGANALTCGAVTASDVVTAAYTSSGVSKTLLGLTNAGTSANSSVRVLLATGVAVGTASNGSDILWQAAGSVNVGQLVVNTNGSGGSSMIFGVRTNAGALTNRLTIAEDGAFTFAGTGAFSGLVSANAGLTVASGQTLTVTGATVTGAPTWSSTQTMNITGNASGSAATVTGAAQSAITSVGTLSSLTVGGALAMSGTLTMTALVSTIVPGATSWGVRNNANSLDNIIITDAGVTTLRSLAGTGTRTVVADANGVLSAP